MFLSCVKEFLKLPQKISSRLNWSIPKVQVEVSNGIAGLEKRTISVIATCLNEAENIELWLNALYVQSLMPDEVVICDGGSTDNTVQLATKWRQDHQKLKVVLTKSPGANIAKGRNEAVKSSSFEILLFSDVGSVPGKEWVRELCLPLMANPEGSVSLGRSVCDEASTIAAAVGRLIIQDEKEIVPSNYLASGRSIGVTRKAFDEVGGFPEELTFAGEDTLFNIRLREKLGKGFYFSPNAIAHWNPPRELSKIWRMLFRYSKGDGEGGLFYREYLARLVELNSILLGIFLALYSSYYAVSRHQYGILLVTLVAVYFAIGPLLAYQHRLKGFKLRERLLAPFLLITSQSTGFLCGVFKLR